MVFNDHDRVPLGAQFEQHVDQFLHVAEGKARGRLVEDVDGVLVRRAPKFARQLHALGFAAGQGGRGLAEADVVEAHRRERGQGAVDLSVLGEELDRLAHRHLQHVVDGLALPRDFEAFAGVALAVADVAGDPHIGKEVHLEFDGATAPAGFAAAAFHVEREGPRRVAAFF